MVRPSPHPTGGRMTSFHRNELTGMVSMGLICLVILIFGTEGLLQIPAGKIEVQTQMACWLTLSLCWVGSAYFFLHARDIARDARVIHF